MEIHQFDRSQSSQSRINIATIPIIALFNKSFLKIINTPLQTLVQQNLITKFQKTINIIHIINYREIRHRYRFFSRFLQFTL